MSRHLERHEEILSMSVQALAYAKKKANITDNDIPDENILSMSKTEYKAAEQNVMFALYNQVKKEHRVRPNNNQLKQLANSGSLNVQGVELSYDRKTMSAFINGNPVYVNPLIDAGEKPKGSDVIEYSKQRKTYLIESIVNQRAYIDHDHLGKKDSFGNEINAAFNIRKAHEALRELNPDKSGVNPNNIFKLELTEAHKVRLLTQKIQENKERILTDFSKLSEVEGQALQKAETDAHLQKMAKALANRTISPMEALKSAPVHNISSDHNFIKNNLDGIEGKNPFPMHQLKEIPKGYEPVKVKIDRSLEPTDDFGDNDMMLLSKTYLAFQKTVDELDRLKDGIKIDYSNGVDLDKLYVKTHKVSGRFIKESKSSVMDSNDKYSLVNRGDFSLPIPSSIGEKISDYNSIIVSKGAVASGAIQKVVSDNPDLKDKVLVVDAMEDRNVFDVVSNFREQTNASIAVFTDSENLQKTLDSIADNRLNTFLSEEGKWSKQAVESYKNDNFEKFSQKIESDIRRTLLLNKEAKQLPSNAEQHSNVNKSEVTHNSTQSNQDIKPSHPNNNQSNPDYRRGM